MYTGNVAHGTPASRPPCCEKCYWHVPMAAEIDGKDAETYAYERVQIQLWRYCMHTLNLMHNMHTTTRMHNMHTYYAY